MQKLESLVAQSRTGFRDSAEYDGVRFKSEKVPMNNSRINFRMHALLAILSKSEREGTVRA
jgi:hypothetical protein